jgi:hypothetical protein
MSIKNLPSLKQWENALGGNSKFIKDFHKDLPDSQGGRIALFCRVFSRMKMKEDSRPDFYKWKKGFSFNTVAEAEEFLGYPFKDFQKESFVEDYLEGGKKTFPPSFIMELNAKYNEIYPEGEYVTKTPLGGLAFSYMDVVKGGELESYITSYLKSFLYEVVFIYKQCLQAKEKGEDYKKLQINWRSLLHKRFLMNDFSSFHREHYCSNVLCEISSPWKVSVWGYEEFIADFIVHSLCKDFGLDIVSTSGVSEQLYGCWESWINLDTETFTLDDSVDKMTRSTLYNIFVEKNGKLWEDGFVNSLG